MKLDTLAAAGVAEILPEAGIYRHHFARAAFGIRADGFPKAGARRTERRVEVEVEVEDSRKAGGRAPRRSAFSS